MSTESGETLHATLPLGAAQAEAAAHTGDARSDEPVRIAGRYVLGETIGQGGFGSVYRAHDPLTGRDVAIKLMHPRAEVDSAPFRTEVTLLRLLRLPNVVHLLDDGVHEGRPFLVMSLVDGTPFPGVPSPATWEEIAEPTYAILQALARVHAYGVVHRDLKPANVLVSAFGQPTILDLGVAHGPGFVEENERLMMGTPGFLAPEQALGHRGDLRADLYAVGTMLFEALTGELPFAGLGVATLLRAKVYQPARSIRETGVDIPPHVATTIDLLLSTAADARPASATIVLEMLGFQLTDATLPRLGGDALVDFATKRLEAGASLTTFGRRGLGHTRLLADARARLEATGRTVWQVRPSRNPWGSLPIEVRRTVGRLVATDIDAVVRLLREGAARGCVATVDDPAGVDPHTRYAVLAAGLPTLWAKWAPEFLPQPKGQPALTPPSLEVIQLLPLREQEIRGLFHGPDLVFHLREDAARLVHVRTAGYPSRVARLVQAWTSAGLAFWDAGKLRVERAGLDRLSAGLRVATYHVDDVDGQDGDALLSWIALAGSTATRSVLSKSMLWHADAVEGAVENLVADGRVVEAPDGTLHAVGTIPQRGVLPEGVRREAHERIASAVEPGTSGRLIQIVQAGRLDEMVPEAMRVFARTRDSGQLGHAFAALREALGGARYGESANEEYTVLRAFVIVALEMQSPRSLDLALYEIDRSRHCREPAAHLSQLVDGTRLVRYVERASERTLGIARTIPEFREDPVLEKWRRAVSMVAGFGLPPEEHYALALAHMTWAARIGDPDILASVHGWLGLTEYRRHAFAAAAAEHRIAAERAESVVGRLIARTNAASALLEAHAYDEAEAVALEALAEADALRLTAASLRALGYARRAAALSGRSAAKRRDVAELIARLEPRGDAIPLIVADTFLAIATEDREHGALCGRQLVACASATRNINACLLGCAVLHWAEPGAADPYPEWVVPESALPSVLAQAKALAPTLVMDASADARIAQWLAQVSDDHPIELMRVRAIRSALAGG